MANLFFGHFVRYRKCKSKKDKTAVLLQEFDERFSVKPSCGGHLNCVYL